MAGDKILAARPRGEPNMRHDLVDYLRMSTTAQETVEAVIRACLSSPRATVATPTGERWLGSVTANPTAPSDNLVRVDTAVFVGLDADGGLVLKPAGTTLSVAIPDTSTDHQVYVYMQDVAEDPQVRRKISATSPFVESASAIDVAFRQQATLYVRAGGAGTIQAQDAISSVTRPLLFLGIANNTGGVITFTPGANTLETVTAPVALPVTSSGTTTGKTTVTGSGASLRELTNLALHAVARDRWKGSVNFTPSAANNFGAYTEPVAGLDYALRARTVVTVGENASGIYGDYDVSLGAGNVVLTAAYAALPPTGGTIRILPGATLAAFAADLTLTADKPLHLVGNTLQRGESTATSALDLADYAIVCPSSTFHVTLALSNVTLSSSSATATGSFVKLHSFWHLVIKTATLIYTSAYAGVSPTSLIQWDAATVAANVGDVDLVDTYFGYTNAATSGGIVTSVLAHAGTFTAVRCFFLGGSQTSGQALVNFADVRSHFVCDSCTFVSLGTSSGPSSSAGVTAIAITSTDNTVREKVRRSVVNCSFTGRTSGGVNRHLLGVVINQVANVQVLNCDFAECVRGVALTNTSSYRANLMVSECTFDGLFGTPVYLDPAVGTTITGIAVLDNRFDTGLNLSVDGGSAIKGTVKAATLKDVKISGNKIYDYNVQFECACTGLDFVHNLIERLTVSIFRGFIYDTTVSGGLLIECRVEDNTFRGQQDTTNVSVGLCVHIASGGTAIDVSVSRNYFRSIDNVAFAGASAAVHDVIRVLGGSMSGVRVDGNEFTLIASSMSGANAAAVALVRIDSVDLSTVSLSCTAVSVSHNQLHGLTGAGGSNVYGVVIDHAVSLITCQVNNNNWTYDGSTLGRTLATVRIVATLSHNLVISENMSYFSGSVAAWQKDVLWLAGTFRNVVVRGNQWTNTQVNGFASGWGINFSTATIVYLIFTENAGYLFSDNTNNNAKFNYVAAVSVTVSQPAEPAAAAYWSNNLNIGRN